METKNTRPKKGGLAIEVFVDHTDVVNRPKEPPTPHKHRCPCGGVIYGKQNRMVRAGITYLCRKCGKTYFKELCNCGGLMRAKSTGKATCLVCGEHKWYCNPDLRWQPCPKCGFVGALRYKGRNKRSTTPDGEPKCRIHCRKCGKESLTCADQPHATHATPKEMLQRPKCPRCGGAARKDARGKYKYWKCRDCGKHWKREE